MKLRFQQLQLPHIFPYNQKDQGLTHTLQLYQIAYFFCDNNNFMKYNLTYPFSRFNQLNITSSPPTAPSSPPSPAQPVAIAHTASYSLPKPPLIYPMG